KLILASSSWKSPGGTTGSAWRKQEAKPSVMLTASSAAPTFFTAAMRTFPFVFRTPVMPYRLTPNVRHSDAVAGLGDEELGFKILQRRTSNLARCAGAMYAVYL